MKELLGPRDSMTDALQAAKDAVQAANPGRYISVEFWDGMDSGWEAAGRWFRERWKPKPTTCPDCGGEKSKRAVKGCGACWYKRGKRAEIIRLAQSGAFKTQQCVADRVGLTRERVRQVLQEAGLAFDRRQPNTLLSWPCPRCGATVEMWSKLRNSNPSDEDVFCAPCRKQRQHERCWVTLTCPDCGMAREIPRSQEKLHKSQLCKSCWRGKFHELSPNVIKHRERLAAEARA